MLMLLTEGSAIVVHFAANYARHVAPAALFASEQIEKGQRSGGLEVCLRCISLKERDREKEKAAGLSPRPTELDSSTCDNPSTAKVF